MLSWISANSGDIIVLLVLGLVVGVVIAAMIRDKKKGNGCCGGCSGCSGCAAKGSCASCNGSCTSK